MIFFIFNIVCVIVLFGMYLINIINKIPNKRFILINIILGFFIGIIYLDKADQISWIQIIIAIILYILYVILCGYIIDICNVGKIYEAIKAIKAHKNIYIDAFCVMIGYVCITVLFFLNTVAFFKRYNYYNNFNNFKSYIFFIIISITMIIGCIFLTVSLITLCSKTEFKLSIYQQYFLLLYLIVICIFSFAILNTSLNCISIYQKEVILQEDYFIDYLYQYACIFTLQDNV